jgi:hypothetical protein
MNTIKLQQFTNRDVLHTIGHDRLALLLSRFGSDLSNAGLSAPPPQDSAFPPVNGEYFEAVAAVLAAPQLPAPLLSTLLTLEHAAATENADTLDEIIRRRIPCIGLNRACPVDCALELFFACPEELVQFRNGESSSLTAPESDEGGPSGTVAPVAPSSDVTEPVAPESSTGDTGSACNGDRDSGREQSSPDQPEIQDQKSKIENQTGSSSLEIPPNWLMQVDPWPEPVNAATLLDRLRVLFTQSVVLPKWVPELLPLFVLHTYAFHLRDVSVYLGVESPVRRCGKTTLLSLLLRLINRPVVASSVSASSFFHVIQELKPTLMIDEADRFLKSREELQGILNAGYTPDTAIVIRMGPPAPGSKAQSAVNFFSVWCPKVIAQIGHLPETLADRSIVFRMQRKIATEQCQRIRNLNTLDLRRHCARFALDHSQGITCARPEIPDALNDRAADIWEPLLVLADLAGGNWPRLGRDAAIGLAGAADENNSNPISSLLLDIFFLFTLRKVDRMFTRDLLVGLNSQFAGRPWMEQLARKSNGVRKEITDLWLSRQLRPFGIKPCTLWINDRSAKGYRSEDFRDVFKRYISNTDLQNLLAEHAPRPGGDANTKGAAAADGIAERPEEPSC